MNLGIIRYVSEHPPTATSLSWRNLNSKPYNVIIDTGNKGGETNSRRIKVLRRQRRVFICRP